MNLHGVTNPNHAWTTKMAYRHNQCIAAMVDSQGATSILKVQVQPFWPKSARMTRGLSWFIWLTPAIREIFSTWKSLGRARPIRLRYTCIFFTRLDYERLLICNTPMQRFLQPVIESLFQWWKEVFEYASAINRERGDDNDLRQVIPMPFSFHQDVDCRRM